VTRLNVPKVKRRKGEDGGGVNPSPYSAEGEEGEKKELYGAKRKCERGGGRVRFGEGPYLPFNLWAWGGGAENRIIKSLLLCH